LELDAAQEIERLCDGIRRTIHHESRRRGAVVGVSGGVDSAVVLALCARAMKPERTLALILPERESSSDSERLAKAWASELGVAWVKEDLTGALEGLGAYRRRDEAIRRIFPDYGEGWKSKITLPGSLLEDDTLNVFKLTVVDPEGQESSSRMLSNDFFQIMAATDMKQRTRMSMLYYHAEKCHYAVVGTGNKNEHDLGFFVKYGDGGSDLAPIMHLFKSQVYQLADHLNVLPEIVERVPTSDTYSAGSSQEEFFFRLPFKTLDLIWACWEQGVDLADIGSEVDLETEQVKRVVEDIKHKQQTTHYLRREVVTFEPGGAKE
ncbi:MAG: NAD(+) synthase, partial [Anaerolineales bacterium]